MSLPLVSLPHSSGIAAIVAREDPDGLELRSFAEAGGVLLDGYRPAADGLSSDEWVVGGRLPPSASGAELVSLHGARSAARTGAGVWLARGDTSEPVVRCHDDDGRTVARPIPDRWKRARVEDATEHCPACAAMDWEEVVADDRSRGESGTGDHDLSPTPFVRCATCGHEEGGWSLYAALPGEAGPDEDDQDLRRALRREARRALTGYAGPVYAARGWDGARRLDEWRESPHGTTRVGVGHHPPSDRDGTSLLTVASELGRIPFEDPPQAARRELERLLSDGHEWLDASRAAFSLWQSARDRERHARGKAAAVVERELVVDGSPVLADLRLV